MSKRGGGSYKGVQQRTTSTPTSFSQSTQVQKPYRVRMTEQYGATSHTSTSWGSGGGGGLGILIGLALLLAIPVCSALAVLAKVAK